MQRHPSSVSRRTVSAGLAWSVPSVAAVAAAPARATSQCVPGPGEEDAAYRFDGMVALFADTDPEAECFLGEDDPGRQLSSLTLYMPTVDDSLSPAGFAIVNDLLTDGSGNMSPTTEATLSAPPKFVVAYPVGTVDLSKGENVFTFAAGTGTNWKAPAHATATMTPVLDDEPGQPQLYDVFTFTWKGDLKQETVVDPANGMEVPASWAGTSLEGTWAVAPEACLPTQGLFAFAGYPEGAAFTTANCAAGKSASVGGWVQLAALIRG